MLRTVDLRDVDGDDGFVVTGDEWRAELARPRAERRGLPSVPSHMSCVGEDATRMREAIGRAMSANAAARARAMARSRLSATDR